VKRIDVLAGNVIFVAVAASVVLEQRGRCAGIDSGAYWIQAMVFLLIIVTFQAATVNYFRCEFPKYRAEVLQKQLTYTQHGLRQRFNDHRGAKCIDMAG
jgi:hypothetical protein